MLLIAETLGMRPGRCSHRRAGPNDRPSLTPTPDDAMIKVSFFSPSVLAPPLPRLACYLSWVLPRHNREFGLSASPAMSLHASDLSSCGSRAWPASLRQTRAAERPLHGSDRQRTLA